LLILGFKGCELTDEPGKYLVRQEHAHAWVQALVPVPDQPLGPRLRTGDLCYWLTLDPTPQNETSGSGDGADNWLQLAEQWLRSRFREYFVNSTPEQRQEAVAAAVRWLVQPRVLAVAVLLVLGGVGVFVLRRRSRQRVAWPTPEHRWFDRLLAVLAAQGLVPAPGQTPREFALQVGTVLRQSPATRAVADVPLAWAEAYYETRFGGVPLAPDRQRALDTQLDQLQQALTA
jgi:hypothetical protein